MWRSDAVFPPFVRSIKWGVERRRRATVHKVLTHLCPVSRVMRGMREVRRGNIVNKFTRGETFVDEATGGNICTFVDNVTLWEPFVNKFKRSSTDNAL